ncbi:FadD3 family acyl-CoA ligase [Humibacter sp.]|uniref:FadD3 family acyl-CoA ligase n=1 Tax=Humibacter sp. TaxID=1940291 RepID=UPI002C7DAB5E|nr:FadD3 family acyl-CoA ligase [Humibacter sp.]HVX09158.1 FadD3 family acyl-CoA ligase [Humibacter sp.]
MPASDAMGDLATTPQDVDPRADRLWPTTAAVLAHRAATTPHAEALVDGERRWTWADLDDAVDAAARSMIASSVRHGDRVAVWAPNCAEWIVAALGAQRVGGVLVPLNTRFLGPEAAFVLRRSRARLLVTVAGFLGKDYPAMLEAAGEPLPALDRIVEIGGEPRNGVQTWEDFLAAGAAVHDDELEARAQAVSPHDLSDVLFTSGTTGRPKGAMCTHAQTLRAYGVWSAVVGLREGDRYLVVNPFFHGFGYKAGWLACLLTGACIVPQRTLDVPEVLRVIARERITVLPGTPTLYQTMLEHPDFSRDGVETLRLAVTGAAAVPAPLLERVRDEIGFSDVVTGYGLTESCAIVSMCRYDDPVEVVATTAGRPLPGLDVRTVDAEGTPTAPGVPGEIHVRGYTVMRGYLDDPEATSQVIDADGWLHTGDVGIIDDSGRVHITDRIKDMYIVGGFNAYPAEIEGILLGHPEVAQVAVIGVPDERMGEVGVAFVIPRQGRSITADDVVTYARANMANYKVPRRVRIVESLPMNASGKVLKGELRAAGLEGSLSW